MRVTLATIMMVLSLPAGAAVAGTAYDRCIAEEKALQAKVADQCSGFSYLLNPSACFVDQKALKAFDGDKCRKIGRAEKTEAEPGQSITVAVPALIRDNGSAKAPHEAPAPEPDMERLKAENARLRAEVARLSAEIERLKKDCMPSGICPGK